MKKITRNIIIVLLSIVAVSVLLELWISKYGLGITHYSLGDNAENDTIRIVQLTDQHNSIFGESNEKLISKIQSVKPDIICITGDQINNNSTKKDVDIACKLISDLSGIAPVYISFGNHEAAWNIQHEGQNIADYYKDAGAEVLEYEWRDISIKGALIRIGGIYGYCLPDTYTGEYREEECDFLHEFEDTERYKLLLCHMPVCWVYNHGLDSWDVDLVLAGHIHGGQIRIPFVGGLYAPDMGWFPGEVKGVYLSSDKTKKMVISSGLGSYDKFPRFNNIPEIVLIDLSVDNSKE